MRLVSRAASAVALLVLAPIVCIAQNLDFDINLLGVHDEDFFDLSATTLAQLSPDGAYYAFTHNRTRGAKIQVKGIADPGYQMWFGNDNARRDEIFSLQWKDERRLIYQTEDGNLFVADAESRTSTKIYDAERLLIFGTAIFWDNFSMPSIVSLLPDDPDHILISAFDRKMKRMLFRIPLTKWDNNSPPKPFQKNPSSFDLWYADNAGNVRLAMKLSAKRTELFYSADSSWKPLKALLKDRGLDFEVTKRNIVQPRDYLVGFGDTPSTVIFASNRETDTTSLYLFDLESQSVVRQIASDSRYDLVDTSTGEGLFITDQANGSILGIAYQAERPRILWIDERMKPLQAAIDALLPDACNLIFDLDKSRSVALVQSVRSSRPPITYLWRVEKNTIERIGGSKSPIEGAELQKTEPIAFTTSDGRSLEGYFTPARSERDGVQPMVLLVHGGPWARDSYGYDPMVQCLSYRGYSVLQINYRGSLGYGFEHYTSGNFNYGEAVQLDLEEAMKWSIASGHSLEGNAAIMGFSFGGYESALSAARLSKYFRCAIPLSGIYDLRFEAKRLKDNEGGSLLYEHWKQMVGSDWTDNDRLAEYSPINLTDRIQIPILMAHGRLDTVASIEHANRFHERLKKSGAEVDFIVLEEEGHSLDQPKNQAYLMGRIISFLDRHLDKP